MAGKTIKATAAAAAALAGLLMIGPAAASKGDYSQHVLIQLPATKERVERLENLPFADVWSVTPKTIDVMVHRDDVRTVDPENVGRIVVGNIQEHIDTHAPRARKNDWAVGRNGGFFADFRQADEFVDYIDQLVGNYSSILTKLEAGETYEGRPIYGVRLNTGGGAKPAFYIQANVHAREWLAPTTNLWTLTGLVEDYTSGTEPGASAAAKFDWYIVPMVNIDGYLFTWTDDRLWRKNRRHNSGNSYGVDINRNWDAAWCTSGSSTNPNADTYCGPSPASEPETQMGARYIDTLSNLAAAIDFHCYGPLILYPFQHTYDEPPADYFNNVRNKGLAMQEAIRAVHGYPFEAIQGVDLYPHSGGMIDYTYYERNATAYTIELRGNSFIVPASDIVLSGEEAYAGVLQLAQDL